MTNIAQYIDHTLLRPDATESDIINLCNEANEYKFAAICVAPCWNYIAKPKLKPEVNLCTVANFPHGNGYLPTNFYYPDEIDFVLNIGYVKSKKWEQLDMFPMRHCGVKTVKVIVEVGYLTDEELFKVADILIKHKIDFIKTCTGYGPRNVTIDDITKIKKHVGDRIKIKASGGIKTYEFARQLIDAGADRIGTSSGVAIIKESLNDGQGFELEQGTTSY